MSQCELAAFAVDGIKAIPMQVKARMSPGLKGLSISGILSALNGVGLSLPPPTAIDPRRTGRRQVRYESALRRIASRRT